MIGYTFENKHFLEHTDKCGCFYCKKIFNPNEIQEWCDQQMTAICPYCGVDSIIPETDKIKITNELLEELNKKYFMEKK